MFFAIYGFLVCDAFIFYVGFCFILFFGHMILE